MALMGGGQYAGPIKLQDAVDETGNGEELDVMTPSNGSFSVAAFQVTGTFSATVTFQGTIDGTNWVAIEAYEMDDSATLITTTTTAGLFRANVLGLKKVRATVTWTSGTSITVWGTLVS